MPWHVHLLDHLLGLLWDHILQVMNLLPVQAAVIGFWLAWEGSGTPVNEGPEEEGLEGSKCCTQDGIAW